MSCSLSEAEHILQMKMSMCQRCRKLIRMQSHTIEVTDTTCHGPVKLTSGTTIPPSSMPQVPLSVCERVISTREHQEQTDGINNESSTWKGQNYPALSTAWPSSMFITQLCILKHKHRLSIAEILLLLFSYKR